jgi:hypothetical protein
MRSPTYDYPGEPVTTADGDTLGADRQSISDGLDIGPTVGSEGVKLPEYGEPEEAPEVTHTEEIKEIQQAVEGEVPERIAPAEK